MPYLVETISDDHCWTHNGFLQPAARGARAVVDEKPHPLSRSLILIREVPVEALSPPKPTKKATASASQKTPKRQKPAPTQQPKAPDPEA